MVRFMFGCGLPTLNKGSDILLFKNVVNIKIYNCKTKIIIAYWHIIPYNIEIIRKYTNSLHFLKNKMELIKLTDEVWKKKYRDPKCLKIVLFSNSSTIAANFQEYLEEHMISFPSVTFFLAKCQRFSFITSMYNPFNKPGLVLIKGEALMEKIDKDDVKELDTFFETVRTYMQK